MPDDEIAGGTEDETASGPETTGPETAVAESEQPEEFKLSMELAIEDVGPCKKHVRITIPREDITHVYDEEVGELVSSAEVPGFRPGRVPKKLVEKRFRKELADKVKQRLLMDSLEQLSEEDKLDPISQPDLDVEDIEVPEEGDFEYEFDVEVRPEFELPQYSGLPVRRPVREISEAEVDAFLERYLAQYGELEACTGPAQANDYVTVSVQFSHDGRPLRKLPELTVQIKPVLQFSDAELEGFDKLMAKAAVGETRETDLTISSEAASIEMRGETVHAAFQVKNVRRMKLPELGASLLNRIGVESKDELREEIREMLERQAVYQQRQAVREQVMEQITESTDWELPEDLVLSQVENALRREILEMQQAGFTNQEIQARENQLRQRAVSTTRQALKEHFVLDKIATEENIEVDPSDIDKELALMAMQRGESPRRIRARLAKSGMIDNLEAQIRERKAVDVILAKAQFDDYTPETQDESRVAAVRQSVCGMAVETETAQEAAEEEADQDQTDD